MRHNNKSETDLVIFRHFSDGDIIAIFPLIPATFDGWFCQSYMHVGQHSACDPGISRRTDTRPAKPSEYASLKRELEQIGYKLKIGSRVPRNAFNVRKAAIPTK